VIPDPLGDAVGWLEGGGLLAYPTETVWGLGAGAVLQPSVALLHRWKRRDPADPVSVLVEDAAAAEALGFVLGAAALRLARAFWPGPLTLVVPGPGPFGQGVAREDGAVGLRCSSHPLATALARRLHREGVGPVTATSLNRSGEPAARTAGEARALCGSGREDARLIGVEGAESGGDATTTVVDTTGETPRVLRWGALRAEDLDPLLQEFGAR
jgi:tRNA threonylcarbamoyl adenosine modification protein (Sua5/YciO/YrdC/YwlC family)